MTSPVLLCILELMSSDIDWAWAAGFYEGEGTMVCNPQYNNLALSISQKDPESLYRFMDITRVGKIYGPYKRNIYAYSVGKRHDVFFIAARMWPWLTTRRREQFAMAFDRFALAREVII